MNILAVESSCDETAVAIVRDGREVLTDCIASQVDLHRLYGGVVPEIASRKHIEAIYGLADQALINTGLTRDDIDAVAIGGLVQEKLSRLPKVGDHFVWGSFDGTVTRATNRRVQEVRLVSRPPEPETKKPDRRDRDKD